MKRNIVLVLTGVIVLLAVICIMLMWPRRASEPDSFQEIAEYEIPAVEEAMVAPPPDYEFLETGELEEFEEELKIDDQPETFHDLVDDVSRQGDEDGIKFQEEGWETVEGDTESVPPIFRIAPTE